MFNIEEIKKIPILEVCSLYGLKVDNKGKNFITSIRKEDKTPSCIIYTDNNKWKDYGTNEGGSVIDLVMKIEQIPTGEAIFQLGTKFGVNKNESYSVLPSNSEYIEIGINPSRAMANFIIDLEQQELEKLELWESKYAIPMRDLYFKNKMIYSRIMKSKALPIIEKERTLYYEFLNKYREAKDDLTRHLYFTNIKTLERSINRKIDIYNKGRSRNFTISDKKVRFCTRQ